MPAIIDDPATPTIYRVSGEPPFPDPNKPALPASITPRQVTLRDKQTVATVVPFASRDQVPPSLLLYLADQFAKEIIKGDTYPMMEPLSHEKFAAYWFQNFGAIMLLGHIEKPEDVVEGKDWAKECLGSFYTKPNYPGRSSHICNAGFLVTDASRNRGVGRLMGEAYLNWAPKLGYSYSVFNLVYETNVASCRIWDALGFKRIGRVPRCGNLKSYPGRLVDAIIYGRDLVENDEGGQAADELVSQDRFEKIKFYLKHGKYPDGADRAEKSRLRSSATHYTLTEADVLMLNNKECIADSGVQYGIAREVHAARQHGGINKTTAAIAERYHWSRIKDTVSDVIRACAECNEVKDTSKSPVAGTGTLAKPPPVVMNSDPDPATGSSAHGTRDRIAARLVCHACHPPRRDFTTTQSFFEHCRIAHGKRVTSSQKEAAGHPNDDPLTVNEIDADLVDPTMAESDTSIPGPLIRSGLQGETGHDHGDFLGINHRIDSSSSNSRPHPTLPSAGLDMGHNDPELSALFHFLETPASPPHSAVTEQHEHHHHGYQPIDPQLTSHEQAFLNQLHGSHSSPLSPEGEGRHEQGTFFVDQRAGGGGGEEDTGMDIDDDRGHQVNG